MGKFYILLLFIITFLSLASANAQLNAGDIAFVHFSKEEDGFGIVTFKNIPAGTTLYFRDNKWTGTAFSGASVITWVTATNIAPGTVVKFNTVNTTPTTAPTTVTQSVTGSYGLGSDDAVWCYIGSDANTPTTFLAAIANGTLAASFSTLAGTGLTENSTAILLTAGTDEGRYVGPRNNPLQSGHLAALNDIANNWEIQVTGTVPALDLAAFTFNAVDNDPPLVSFSPANNATDIATNVAPALTFNENIRLVNNTTIDNANVDNIVELRLNNETGSVVSFDAAINGQVITITPSLPLSNNQVYYVALKGNTVEDGNDNAVGLQSSTFTTISIQTQFQPGDLLFVAYQMNAVPNADRIGILTLVDILPGTRINFTDTKYTDNPQPQCAGGFTWKAPSNGVAAGTVITIFNDALTTPIGTLSGSGFGLSSDGDQVIVYTGAASNPSYITALSSKAWTTSALSTCSGSNSKLPAGLIDGQSSINLSTAPGASNSNTVNAYYNGTQTGSVAVLRAAILNPANWIGSLSASTAQTWPTWTFPGPPAVISTKVMTQTTLKVVFSTTLDNTSATNHANYTGISNLQSATLSTDGKEVTLVYGTPFSNGGSYTLTINGIKDIDNRLMASAYNNDFTYSTKIGFEKKFISVNEQAGTVTVNLKVENPSPSSVNLVVKGSPWSSAVAADYTLTNQIITLTGNSDLVRTITIPIVNDTDEEQDEYLVLSLETPTGVAIQGSSYITIFIKDNDRLAPQATKAIELKHASSYSPPVKGTAEIVVHDAPSQRLFIISSIENRLDIANFSNPAAITHITSIDMTPYGGITSVATKNGIVAVACPNVDQQLNGSVVFFTINGEFQKKVSVGALPDMITFTPDGKKILTANEGQPNDSYTIDPEGSVSVIDISAGVTALSQANVTTLLFNGFNAQEAALKAAGVRKLKSSSTLSQDFEPEYITISADSKKAWITLQENNAIAELNLETNAYSSVWAMGKKDYNAFGNGFDASDNSGVVHISNWPVKGFYIPDAIANYTVGANQYLVTANEGDEKEYAGLNERTTVSAVTLDPVVFPHAAVLKETHNLGRLRMTNLSGDTDGDGDYDEINIPGGRSFTIWNAATKEKVFDSGDQFERITAADPVYGVLFNSDNEGNSFKSRSRAKGPEPEGVTLASFGNRTFAFVALERVGGVMVYDITDPLAVKFVDYKNNRSTTSFSGDHGPEGVVYVSRENSPDKKRYILVANEISGSVSVYEILGTLCVNPPQPTITLSGENTANAVLTSSALAGNQWYKDGVLIEGATNQTFTLSTYGIYTVKVSVEECQSATSQPMPILVTGLASGEKNVLKLYPNPAQDHVILSLPGEGTKEISIYGTNGLLIKSFNSRGQQEVLDVQKLGNGYFIVKVKTASDIYYGKFIKH